MFLGQPFSLELQGVVWAWSSGVQWVKDFLKQRSDHYDDVPEVQLESDSDSDQDDFKESEQGVSSTRATGLDWRKYVLIKANWEPKNQML